SAGLSLSSRAGLRIVRSRVRIMGCSGRSGFFGQCWGNAGRRRPGPRRTGLGPRAERAEMSGREYAGSRVSTEPTRFFLNWLQNPLTVGAVAPSGRELARLMTAGLAPGARVVELGAGTGTLT